MSDQPICDQSFLGRVFDSYQNMMQIARCIREASRQLSVAQPRILELSRRETGIQEYLPEANVFRHATHSNDATTLTFPVTLPFADSSFEACLVTDAYEHIPEHLRSSLLREMLRVTHGLVLVGCPNGNEVVSRFDKIVFDFIWGKYGERFGPLEQHVEFGLESPDQVVERLKGQGADHITVLPANYVYRWIHMILVFFDLQHKNPYWDVFEPFNRIYNQYISPYDYREPCYRYLLAISNHPALDIKAFKSLKTLDEKPAPANELDGLVAQTFRDIDSTAADQLRECSTEIERLQSLSMEAAQKDSIIAERDKTICALNEKLERLHSVLREAEEAKLKLAAQKDSIIAERETAICLGDEEIERLRALLVDSEAKRLELATHRASLESIIMEKEQARQAVSAQLAATESSLASMTSSPAWRLASRYGKIKRAFLLPVYRILGLPYRESADLKREI
ncbi:MAG: hypothetical protein M3R52_03465 [Acidobacteriota bacterium]|nr:hypothetical protein [Acidobacteriota bacterium]